MSTLLSCYVECEHAGVWTVPEAWLAQWNPVDDPEPPSGLCPRPLYRAVNNGLAALLANDVNQDLSSCQLPAFPSHHGLPPDVSKQLRVYVAACGDTIWSTFWVEASDIASFDWNQDVVCSGQVEAEIAHLFSAPPEPFPRHMSPLNKPISVARIRKDGVTVQWTEPLAERAAAFLEKYDEAAELIKGRQMRVIGWLSS